MRFGEFEIHTFVERKFRLDGGSMFGIVPKTIWQRSIPADESNLIPMVTNLFVLSAHGRNMIFDIGFGDTLTDREKKIYGTNGVSNLESGLANLGLTVNDINYVILSHLHTDHAGGAVKLVDDRYIPRFPKATYVISEVEWDIALNPDERTAAVYVPDRLRPLREAGQVEFIESDSELLPGIRTVFTGGHTSGHFALEIESGGTSVFYYADIYCTSAHLKTPYVPATDLYPMETMEIKRRTLSRVVDQDVVMAFDHDVNTPLARIRQSGKKLVTEPIDNN